MCYYCGNQAKLRFCYKAKNIHQENANNTKEDDGYAFATQYGTHSEAMCKYTMNSEAYNHIISCSATFDTYEVIDSRNVYLDDDSVVEAIGMGCIIGEIIVKGKIKIICIKNTFHVPKLQANLLSVNKLLLDGLKVQFNLNEYIVRGPNREVNVIGLHKGNLYKTHDFPRCMERIWPIWHNQWRKTVHVSLGIISLNI